MAGALEEGVKGVAGVATGVVDSMKSQPLAIAMVVMNIGLLLFLFYYLTRITSRTETTVAALFASNDKLFQQWGTIVKDQGALVEKSMHCILPEDALKLIQVPPRPAPSEPPARPAPPAPLTPSPNDQRGDLKGDGVKHLVEWQKLQIDNPRPFTFEQPKPPSIGPAAPEAKEEEKQ